MVTPSLKAYTPTPNASHENARLCFREFMLQDESGRMYPLVGWLEWGGGGDPALHCRERDGYGQLGITLANYRAVSEIDELALLTREYYKIMRQVCSLPYKEPPLDTSISSWIAQCLESLQKGKDLIVERANA